MTDNEIIKSLECCSGGNLDDCACCPMCNQPNLITTKACTEFVTMHALDIINRQKAEIDRLREERKQREGEWIDRDGKTWCSLCNASNKQYKPPFCPHCGARMKCGE